jgi:hypothetical protein
VTTIINVYIKQVGLSVNSKAVCMFFGMLIFMPAAQAVFSKVNNALNSVIFDVARLIDTAGVSSGVWRPNMVRLGGSAFAAASQQLSRGQVVNAFTIAAETLVEGVTTQSSNLPMAPVEKFVALHESGSKVVFVVALTLLSVHVVKGFLFSAKGEKLAENERADVKNKEELSPEELFSRRAQALVSQSKPYAVPSRG